jgi:hypothetical protein
MFDFERHRRATFKKTPKIERATTAGESGPVELQGRRRLIIDASPTDTDLCQVEA